MRSQPFIVVVVLFGGLFGLTGKSALADSTSLFHEEFRIVILAGSLFGQPGELLFQDDFQTGDLSRHNDKFRWGRDSVPSPGSGSQRIHEVIGPDGEPVNALRLRFLGTVDPGATGNAAHFGEQRFHLTETADEIRSDDGESQVMYPELWARYDMRIPDNYHHGLKEGSVPGSNHKGWIHFWKDKYEENMNVMQRFEWWPPWQDQFRGQSVVAFLRRGKADHTMTPDFVRPDYQVPGLDRAWGISENDYGRWIDYGFRVRVSSGKDAMDAVAEVYVDGELALRWENFNSWPDDDDPQKAGFDRGYLLGYHNVGYEETTEFFITNFRIGTSAAAVGLYGGAGK